jgi:broad specificity phosphatase PhoE
MSNASKDLFDGVLLRHGETEDVLTHTISGQRDVPLTALGRSQASSAAWRLARLGIKSIVTSDLQRAAETATIIADALGLPSVQVDQRLRERHWGERQGQPRQATAGPGDDEAPAGGESLNDLEKRVLAAISDATPRCLVVAHSGPIRVVMKHFNRSSASPGPCEWVDMMRYDREELQPIALVGEVLSPGMFVGKAVYVTSREDLDRIDADSLVLLCECSKSVAVEAMARGAATVSLMRSLTSHLTYGRTNSNPYAVALQWPNGFPRDGQRAALEFISPPISNVITPLLPDVPLAPVTDIDSVGGKGAGLRLLESVGFKVPEYQIIDSNVIAGWIACDSLVDRAADWVTRSNLDASAQWAVRSSADVEDGDANSMSGSFESVLNCSLGEVAEAVARVVRSGKNEEIKLRLRSGSLRRLPRMAVIVQRMISPVRMAGTLFMPSPRDPSTFMLEACWGRTGEDLMDGIVQPDLVARFDHECELVHFDRGSVVDIDQTMIEIDCRRVAAEAMSIFKSSGRGDLEFAVAKDGEIWWLQARPLNEAVEVVDRRGFHPAAIEYYRQLAFRVSEANLTPTVHFRCFDIEKGLFGYSAGIRQRDRVFHELIQRAPQHLAAVTEFGWETERRMAEAVNGLGSRSPDEILRLLILHGAAQLPFSIPMSNARMDRYHSNATDNHPTANLLDQLLTEIDQRVGLGIGMNEMTTLLRQPRSTLSVIKVEQAHLAVVRSNDAASDEQVMEVLIPELRDVPDLKGDKMANLREDVLSKAAAIRRQDPYGFSLEAQIQQRSKSLQEGCHRREQLVNDLKRRLPDELAQRFGYWVDYLAMKAETNETHCIYRGRCFLWFARIGYHGTVTST